MDSGIARGAMRSRTERVRGVLPADYEHVACGLPDALPGGCLRADAGDPSGDEHHRHRVRLWIPLEPILLHGVPSPPRALTEGVAGSALSPNGGSSPGRTFTTLNLGCGKEENSLFTELPNKTRFSV